ncbi:class I SAM-dependent methyltransferase [Sphingomonas quercus]|uniref:Methyltransferase n=1 Tax=Sphingomonas quercus TaxID=2842451 RepID=A0ABS6BI16_9SPHN|nr:methyltransferase [Sphingomonas quercus]MBU3077227.1 methyltransferase [Sphingomonas quercus]
MPGFSADTAVGRRPAAIGPLGLFFREFVRHPVMVGSIIPSSRACIDRTLKAVDWAATKVFVEYGPGVGTFTRVVLERMAPDATLVVIDTNKSFIDYLGQTIHDSRLQRCHGSAAEVGSILAGLGFDHADYILSGLPFSTLPLGVGDAIARETHAALRPGGAFLVYQFNPRVRNFLVPHFLRIDDDMEWMNVPPCKIWTAWKD